MKNRDARIKAMSSDKSHTVEDLLNDLQSLQSAFEEEGKSSEDRFECLASPSSVELIAAATRELQAEANLRVTLEKAPWELDGKLGTFKYSSTYSGGTLRECPTRMAKGESLVVVLAWEDDVLVGYGIARIENTHIEIEIIDVDRYSRRASGLCKSVSIDDEEFGIGVGHIVVLALIDAGKRPFHVDATNPSSRYIFKSLGFTSTEANGNPCLLEMA